MYIYWLARSTVLLFLLILYYMFKALSRNKHFQISKSKLFFFFWEKDSKLLTSFIKWNELSIQVRSNLSLRRVGKRGNLTKCRRRKRKGKLQGALQSAVIKKLFSLFCILYIYVTPIVHELSSVLPSCVWSCLFPST